eukprot:gene10709-12455_t
MDDIQSKIAALSDIFSLFDRDTIVEVLKKHNNSFEAAASELSETEPPKKQEVAVPLPLPRPLVMPTNPHTPPQRPTQQQPQPQQQPQNPQNVARDIKNLIGGNIDVTESVIFDIYNAHGGKVEDTVQSIRGLNVDPAIEEQRRALEHLSREKEERDRKQKEEYAKKMYDLQKSEEEKKAAEKRRMLEQKRVELEKQFEAEKIKAEQEAKRASAQERIKLEQERLRLEQEVAQARLLVEQKGALEQERTKLEQERVSKERDSKERQLLEKERLLREKEEELKIRLAKDLEIRQKLEEEMVKRAKLEEEIAKQRAENMMREKKLEEEMSKDRKRIQNEEARLRHESEQREAELLLMTQREIERQRVLFEEQQTRIREQQVSLEAKHQAELEQQLEIQRQRQVEQKEIEELRTKLESLQRNKSEEEVMKQHEIETKRQNEIDLKKQIDDLEKQKEFQRLQILELELIQREKQRLELELRENKAQLEQNKMFTTISLTMTLEGADTVVAHFNLGTQIPSTCWIGIYPTHQPKNERYLTYKAVEGTEGSVPFPNIIPGHYEARLFKDKYELLQTSASVQVGPEVKISAHVLGDEIHVSFNVDPPSTQPGRDWIGLYSDGLRNKKYLESAYANATGSVVFKSPRVPGSYSVRYFVYPTKYNEQAIASFQILDLDKIDVLTPIVSKEEEIRVEYSVNTIVPSTSDWIGLYAVGEENNKNYLRTVYANGTGNGVVSLIAPDKTGEYEVRFFSYAKGKYTTFKVSNKLVVTP